MVTAVFRVLRLGIFQTQTEFWRSGMRYKICLWAILLSFLPMMAYSQTEDNSAVQELYVKSGLARQIELLPAAMQSGFDQKVQEDDEFLKLPRNVQSVMRTSLPEAFAPGKLKKVVLTELARKLSEREIEELLQWFDSPIGRKCAQLEEASSTPEAQEEIEKYAADLKESPPSAERMKSMKELDSVLKVTETSVEIVMDMQVAIALGMTAILPSEQQRKPEDLAREVEKTRPGIEAEVRAEVLVGSLLYTYRSLSEAEIRQYIEFARSSAGAKFISVVNPSVKSAITEGGIRWGKIIGAAFRDLKGVSET